MCPVERWPVTDVAASQEEINPSDENVSLLNRVICNKTGHPPNSAEHIYRFEQYLDAFHHPSPTVRRTTGGTLPIAAPIIKAKLQGWNALDQRQRAQVESLFDNTSESDLRLAYDQFIKKLGRAPLRVLEFFRFFVTFEGNDLSTSPRKPLGDLYLENEEIKKTHQRLSDQLSIVQEEKEGLQEDHNTLKLQQRQCLAELEDERKDKQMYKQKSEEQSSTISALEREISLLKSRISGE